MRRKQLVVIPICLLLLCACAHKYTVPEKQRLTIQESSTMYKALYNSYAVLMNSTAVPEETKVIMRTQVAPVMDNLKDALIAYNDAVIMVQLSGIENPDLDKLHLNYFNAYTKARAMIDGVVKGGAK